MHWDGKLFPEKDYCIELLQIVVTSTNVEKLIAVPKVECLTRKEQKLAVWIALQEWDLVNILRSLCCNTTASKTERFNGAYVNFEMTLKKNLLCLPCKHHI